MLVWAHGINATVDYFDPLLRSWAARGYVVVAPTFPLTHAGTPGGRVYNDYVNQPGDISFVISQVLARYGPSGTQEPGLIDPTRIAVGGHSLGAITVGALVSNRCCLDRRVRAAIEVDGAPLSFAHGGAVHQGIPLLLFHGDADTTFSVNESRTMFADAHTPKYLVVLHGMPHTPFRIPRAANVLAKTISDFLDAYLKGDPQAIERLQRDASVPGFTALSVG